MGPWTSNYTFPALLQEEDPAKREAAVREYFEPIARRILHQRPGVVAFSTATRGMGKESTHDVIVDRYGLFPTHHYTHRGRTPRGWVIYKRVD